MLRYVVTCKGIISINQVYDGIFNMIYTMYDDTIWLFNIAMERSTIFNFDKPSISMGHGFHGYVSHNQRVYIGMNIFL